MHSYKVIQLDSLKRVDDVNLKIRSRRYIVAKFFFLELMVFIHFALSVANQFNSFFAYRLLKPVKILLKHYVSQTKKIFSTFFKIVKDRIKWLFKAVYFLINRLKSIFKKKYLVLASNSNYRVSTFEIVINTAVMGGSSGYFFKDKFFLTEQANLKTDRFAEEYRGTFVRLNSKIYAVPIIHDAYIDGVTLNLMSGVGLNYAHWISECLPRLILALDNLDFTIIKSVTVLINLNSPSTLIEAIATLLKKHCDAVICLVPDGVLVNVEKLVVVKNIGYCQFEPYGHAEQWSYFSSDLLNKLSELQEADTIHAPKRCLYVARSSNVRSIINNSEVMQYFVNKGFEVVQPELMSFDQQVKVFKSACIAIGPTGAAMANCIFMPKNSRVYIICNDSPKNYLGYWKELLGVRGISVNYIFGRATINNNPHSSYYVDLNLLKEVG